MSDTPATLTTGSEQWIGHSIQEGRPAVLTMVNFEARTPGSAIVIGVEPQFQARTVAEATVELDGTDIKGRTWNYHVFNLGTESLIPFKQFYEQNGIKEDPPSNATYAGRVEDRSVTGEWTNNLGQKGHFTVWKSFAEALTGKIAAPSETVGPLTWDQFKKHVSQYKSRGQVMFRGQHSNQYPLRTSLHRLGRTNLFRYVNEDLSRVRHQINALSSNHYYQSAGEDLLGLLSLAQHHGFPTPLLDWTQSPYVAAFFAFDCLTDKSRWLERQDRPPVRVFTFDLEAWRRVDRISARSLKDPLPDLQFLHPPAHNNPRYYPQQSIAAFSNLADIEGYISGYELHNKTQYLTRIDILSNQRELVEDELRFMGITASTLFPGIEGACKSLRSELF